MRISDWSSDVCSSDLRLTEAAVLRAASLVPSFADYMDDAGWMSPIYMRLRDAYGKYRDHWDGLPKIEISDGALLRTGDKGERVRMLRRRLDRKSTRLNSSH